MSGSLSVGCYNALKLYDRLQKPNIVKIAKRFRIAPSTLYRAIQRRDQELIEDREPPQTEK